MARIEAGFGYQAVQRVVGKVVAGTVLVVKGFEAPCTVVLVAEGAAFGVDAGDGQAVGGQLVAGVRAQRVGRAQSLPKRAEWASRA